MPTPNGITPYSDIALSNTLSIDSLVYGSKWGGALGSSVSLSYSFLSDTSLYASDYSSDNEYANSYQLSTNQKNAITSALDSWAAVANIDFALISDSNSSVGDLRFGGYADMGGQAAAWAYLPGGAAVCGDVWIGPATDEANPTAGSYDYLTFVHEIGHALGLKHPFDTDESNSNTLPADVDDVRYTVMSYNDAYAFQPTTPMLLDIAAIQYLYGANMSWHTGNDNYQWSPGQRIFETIWDAGGIDTLDASNQTQAVILNLNSGAFSTIGAQFNSSSGYINNGLTIAYGAQIENALGSAHGDTLIGNAVANVLNGGAGADSMSGGDGSDTYYVDNAGDTVSETNALAATGGTDLVYSSLATYTLGAHVENGFLLAAGAANLTGNSLDNLLYAGAGDNVLDGGTGLDIVAYDLATSAVTVSLATTAAQVTGGSGSDTLLNIENLIGSAYNDKLTGNAAANTLNGGAGNDVLNGSAGADTMTGGEGADTYYVDNVGDTVSETNALAATGGTDLVYSSLAAYTLGAHVENGFLLAAGAANLTGNSLDNLLYAGAGDNVINGAGGTDTLSYARATGAVTVSLASATAQATGGSGSDTLLNIEKLIGSAYNDKLTGNAAANTLNGGAGNDVLNGSAGADTMIGGDGSDTYYVDNAGDTISETNALAATGGTDLVYSSLATYTLGAHVENGFLLAAGAANLTGNSLDNLLYAGAGDNVINGAGGTDTLSYDRATSAVTVSLATTAAQVTGGSGSDTLLNIENLIGSAYNDKLTGNAAANTLNGGAGNDVLNGSAGADTMIGGDGADTYYVDNVGDTVSETNALAATGGTDLVYSSLAAYTLGTHVENGFLWAAGAANLTGNSLDNLLYAGAGDNVINGAGGTDTLSYARATGAVTVSLASATAQATGGSGSDTLLNIEHLIGSNYADSLTGNSANNILRGGEGNDTLIGGLGTDQLYGGLGADNFVFNALDEMGLGALRDVIGDFLSSAGDKLDLATLDANAATLANDAFSFIGSAAFSAAGQLRFADSILYGSTDADTAAEFEIQLLGVSTLNSSDLIA